MTSFRSLTDHEEKDRRGRLNIARGSAGAGTCDRYYRDHGRRWCPAVETGAWRQRRSAFPRGSHAYPLGHHCSRVLLAEASPCKESPYAARPQIRMSNQCQT